MIAGAYRCGSISTSETITTFRLEVSCSDRDIPSVRGSRAMRAFAEASNPRNVDVQAVHFAHLDLAEIVRAARVKRSLYKIWALLALLPECAPRR